MSENGTRDPREVIARRMCALANVSACDFDVWNEDADLILADLAAAGFKILPREPTAKMIEVCAAKFCRGESALQQVRPRIAQDLRDAWDAAAL